MFANSKFMKRVENVEISEINGETIANLIPKTSVRTVRFDPIKFPKSNENLFLFKQEMERENSGRVVPKDKIVAPKKDWEIPISFAILKARTTAILELIITNPNPKQAMAKYLIKFAFQTKDFFIKLILFLNE